MHQKTRAAIVAGILIPIFSGCQTIAPEPLHLSDIKIHLADTPLDVQPIREFAKSLTTKDGNQEFVYDPTDGITLREAQAIALWYNPEVRAARSGILYAEALTNESGKWTDPVFSPKIGTKEVDTDSGTKHRWIIGGNLNITIPVSGRLGAERRLRGAQQNVAELQAQEAEWNTSADLQKTWMHWSASMETLKLLDEHIASLDELVVTTEALAKAGELSAINVRFLRVEHLQRVAERAFAYHETSVARAQVLAVMGLVADAPVDLLHTMNAALPANNEENGPITVAESHPSLTTLRALYEESEKTLQVELRKQYPDIILSPAFEDEENESSLVFGFGLPLPAWNRNKQGITAAVSARKRAKAEVEHSYQHLMIVLAQDISRRSGAKAQRQQLVNDVSPLLDQQLVETRNLLSVGELDVLLLHNVLKQTLEIKQSILESSLKEQLARIDIAAATKPELLIPEPLKEINP
jgi:outer membrane protein TolC